MFNLSLRHLLVGLLFTLIVSYSSLAQTTTFTYQGRLTDNGSPVNGQYDLQFKLFDLLGGGAQQGTTQTLTNITVTSGIFTVQLDFGACASCFNGALRFLEIAAKKTTDSTYTTLSPRQPVNSTPYAIKSQNATSADGLSVACVNCVTSSQIGSVNGSVVTGTIPVASLPTGSASYIQNTTSQQASSNFNISGDGTAGGTLSGNVVNAAAQYNLGGQRVLSNAGFQNLFVGVGVSNTGSQNSFFGFNAGLGNTTGGSNSFFGADAGQNNTTGNDNSFFGAVAGTSNTTGIDNAFFGVQTGLFNTTGGSNAFFGTFAGLNNTTGSGNTFIGQNADFNTPNPTGNFNTLLGYLTQVNSGVTNATAIGANAQVTQSNSLVLGNGANVGIGTTAPTARLHVVGDGLFSGNLTVSGTLNGNLSASIVNATTQYNFGGSRVLSVSGVGSFANSNTFAGIGAGVSSTPDASGNGSFNSFFGQNAGENNTTGQGNSFFGTQAGQLSTGSFNSFFGTSAGANTTISGANAFFGYQAGLANINGGANAFFGYQAGKANTSGGNNEFFGFQAGAGNTSGGGNAFFGQAAGANNGTGTRNTMIGNQADVGANNLNNATAVGSQALVSQSNSLVLGAINGVNGATADTSVGIGTTSPTFKLQVIDPSNTGLRVQTAGSGGTVASFGGTGDFQIDAPGTAGGRLIVKQGGNVGIGTNNPQSKLHVQGEARVTGGNVFIAQPNSLIITSPNGSCWQIRVSDAGALTAASVTCP
jgi:hypothetical protein